MPHAFSVRAIIIKKIEDFSAYPGRCPGLPSHVPLARIGDGVTFIPSQSPNSPKSPISNFRYSPPGPYMPGTEISFSRR